MKKNKKVILLGVLLLFLVLGFFWRKDRQCLDDLFVLHHTKENRSDPVRQSDVEQYMTPLDQELGIPEQKLDYISNALEENPNLEKTVDSISTEAAVEDVQFLFDVLQYSYAGYSYFGTEDIWKDRENRIISSIKMHDTDLTQEELVQILRMNLAFIQDSHFKINYASSVIHSEFYYNDTMEIEEDHSGYYVKDGNQQHETSIRVSRSEPQVNQNEDAYSYQSIDGIPVITMERMYKKDSEDSSVEEFVESGNIISGQKPAILDLRGNTGGQSWGADAWFQNFTGASQTPQVSTLKLSSRIGAYELREIYQTAKEQSLFPPEELLQLEEEIASVDTTKNQWIFTEAKSEKTKNETKLIVLIDGHTASAAEALISYLNTLENVVFIGTNTLGCFLSNANMKCILPHSEIEISYGDQLYFPEGCTEGKGFEPDIWIGGTDALERVLAFLEKGK